jgi:predicted small lipoprotein YifL
VRSLAVVLVMGLLAACGVVGPPIAPEDVGVSRTVEFQKKRDALEAKQREAAESQAASEPQGQDVNLPPLRPIGTR